MATIEVEIAFGLPEKQFLKAVCVAADASVADAIAASGVAEVFPGVTFDELPVGIWGRPVDLDQGLKSGDRVEIYRRLEMDPREARRQLALAGRTMSDVKAD